MKPNSLPSPTGFLKIPPGSVLILSNDSPHGISPVSTSPLGASPMRVDSHLKSQLAGASFTAEGLVRLPPEIEAGPVEYKRSLVNPSGERLNHLTSQLKWRLREGQGEALYEIGVEDDGAALGLSDEDMAKSIKNLIEMASRLNAEVSCLCQCQGKEGVVAEMLVRELREDKYIDVRISVCGAVGSGKSTLIGVLCFGELDDGAGSVRVECFNHPHELASGQTSSISHEIMGFNAKGECINYSSFDDLSWGDIIEHSYRIISFFDLAGHERYSKTTVSGMTGQMPDYCFLVVSACSGVTPTTKEHYRLAVGLHIPVIVIITHVDKVTSAKLKLVQIDIQNALSIKNRLEIKGGSDLMALIRKMNNNEICPFFLISNVSGKNLDLLRKFLNAVPPRNEWEFLKHKSPEVLIDTTYHVPDVGTVVAGTVLSGKIETGCEMLLGPDNDGNFNPVTITSLHSKRVPVHQVSAGQHAAFSLKIPRSMTRKGQVLLEMTPTPPLATCTFEALCVISNPLHLKVGSELVVQCRTVRQTAKVLWIGERTLRNTMSSGGLLSHSSNDSSVARFKFLFRPEYLLVGMRVIFRGCCKGLGTITKIHVSEDETEANTIVTPPFLGSEEPTEFFQMDD